ncbi:MAG: hypothetical protein IEMM0002_0573 [bacterium]|nr:MAG: hypothetical protein IEMM0002_0573 [bacterium]
MTDSVLSLILPGAAYAGEALHHAEEWVLWRDGGWIFNFLILFAALFWLVRRIAVPALKQRSEMIAKEIEDAEKSRMDAMRKVSDLEYKIRQFERESKKIREETLKEGEEITKRIVADADTIAQRILNEARAQIEKESNKAKSRLHNEAVNLSIRFASELLEKNMKERDHGKIVDDYIVRLRKMA